MVHIATELSRKKMKIPLLIGGATTSAIHTAVKISPHYSHPIIHVRDASKVIGVAGKLLSADERTTFIADTEKEYTRLRDKHASNIVKKEYISLDDARKNKFIPDWENHSFVPKLIGTKILDKIDLAEVRQYINWTFFFHAWKLNGKFPAILKDPVKGEEAQKLYDDAQNMLDLIINENWLKAKAVIGLFPAYSSDDDVVILDPDKQESSIIHFLRNQEKKRW